MLRIRALVPHVRIAGGVRRFLELGNHFTRAGHHYALFVPDVTPPDWFDCRFHLRPLDTLGAHPYDVTLCGDAGILHCLASAPSRLRILVALGDRYAAKYKEYLASHPDTLVIGNSSAWKEYLPGVKGLAIPGAVDSAWFSPGPRRAGPYTITVVGEISKKREAIPVLLDAFAALGWKDARVRVVTSGKPVVPWRYWRIRKRIEPVSGRDQRELVNLYRDSDVFVTMERTAGWSNPAAEAMACGVPVICTKFGTTDFASAETARVVEVDDRAELVAALREVREKPEEAKARAERGLAKIREFTWGKVAEGMLRVFEGYIAAAGGHAV